MKKYDEHDDESDDNNGDDDRANEEDCDDVDDDDDDDDVYDDDDDNDLLTLHLSAIPRCSHSRISQAVHLHHEQQLAHKQTLTCKI